MRQIGKHALVRLFLGFTLSASISSCSQDSSVSDTQVNGGSSSAELLESSLENLDEQLSLFEIKAPNPASMDADVAVVVQESWETLNSALNDKNLSPTNRAKAYADYGLTLFGNGLTLSAEPAFKNAVTLAPSDERWIYFLALMQQFSGKLEDSVSSFARVLELRPKNLPTLIRLGKVRFEQAKVEDAAKFYGQALSIDAKSAAAHYGMGLVNSASERHADAVSHFEKALSLQPSADRINYFLGIAWRNLGDSDKAKSYLVKHGSNEPSFEDPLFDEISGGSSRIDGLWVHMSAGSQAFVDANYSLAVQEFKLATQDLPGDPRSWQSLGMALNKVGDGPGAIAAYQGALDLSPDNAVINHELGKLMIAKGDIDTAERYLQRSIEIDSKMVDARATLANFFLNTGRAAQALTQYDRALLLDPQSGKLSISRAEVLVALDRKDEAVISMAEAARINPSDASVKMAYGLVLVDAGKLDQAMTEIQASLTDAKDDNMRSRAHFGIGQVKLRKNNPQAALDSFATALRLNPEYRSAALQLARTFIRIKDYKQALGTYEVFLEKWPNSDSARVEAARVAVMVGNGSKAKSILEEGISNGSASARLIGSLARLLVLSTEVQVKNAKQAVVLAQRALKIDASAQHRETLALAHAGAGHFKQAIEYQERLIKDSAASVSQRVRTRMNKNLERYRTQQLGRLPFDPS